MSDAPRSVLCPRCCSVIPVADDWRVAVCPKCGTPVTRMEADPEYD